MSFEYLYKKSHQLQAEILVEMVDGLIVNEVVGNHSKVHGIILRPNSEVYHTHLTNHPPSAQDILVGLMNTVLYKTSKHGVIGPTKLFTYTYSDELQSALKRMIMDKNHCHETQMSLTSLLKRHITKINQAFIKFDNCEKYIHDLKSIGVKMKIYIIRY
jgi:hypothetical protein